MTQMTNRATDLREIFREAPAFRRALASWFERDQRRLPWRTERSLYRTVVSEFMLQQTQVATVLPYFDRWMQTLPDFPALAAASEATVLKLWEGLGYYRRARFLHQLAKELIGQPTPPTALAHGQKMPSASSLVVSPKLETTGEACCASAAGPRSSRRELNSARPTLD